MEIAYVWKIRNAIGIAVIVAEVLSKLTVHGN